MKRALANLREHIEPIGNLPVDYIITSSIETIENQTVLFLSFFSHKKEKKKNKDKADFKVFICGEKYISQKLQEDGSYKWSSACVENLVGYWGWSSKLKAMCNTLGERENISQILKIKCEKPGEELKAIDSFQKKIMQKKLNVKHEKIKKQIDEAMAKVSPLPKDFDRWIYNGPFGFSRYIYYKRQGRRIMSFCTFPQARFVAISN